METRVPIQQFTHRVPKFKFLGMRFGTKGFNQEMFCENPNATIEYAEYIELR